MAERNNRERPSAPRHEHSSNAPAASTPSSFLSRVFRGSASRSSTSEQSVPTTSTVNAQYGDNRLRPTLSPATSSSSGPSPGISPVLLPHVASSSAARRNRSKSPTRARQRMQDISTAGLHETEEEDGGSTSVGILRHLSQASRQNPPQATTRTALRNADHDASLRDLINTLLDENDGGTTTGRSHSIVSAHHLSNHERASLAVELAAELGSRMDDSHMEQRLKASLAESVQNKAYRRSSSLDADPLAKLLTTTISDIDISHLILRLFSLATGLVADGDRTKQSSGQNLKNAGFKLLAVLLQIQAGDNSNSDMPPNFEESQPQTRSRSSMIDLCLTSPIDMPSQSVGTTLATCEYAVGDLPDRIACLQVLTRHGRDITLNQNIVRTLVQWHQMLLVGWRAWCTDPESWESVAATDTQEVRGRRDEPVASSERDRSSSTITIHFSKDVPTAIPEDTNISVVVRSLRQVWHLLVCIIAQNLPLFSGHDIEFIVGMALSMLKEGIEVTSLNSVPHVAANSEANPAVAKVETPSSSTSASGSRARSGSLLSRNRTLKVPAPPPTTSETGVNQASTFLSRSPSIKTRGAARSTSHGTPPISAAHPDSKFTPVAGMSGAVPPWSRILSPVLDLLRFLLQAKYLPPTSLVSVIQLLALGYGWRSDARCYPVSARSADASTSIINNLDSAGRTQVEHFFRDLFASKLVSRNAERCLRGILGGDVRVDEKNEYEQRAEFRRDVIVGALG